MKMIYVASLSPFPDRDTNWIHAFRALGCEVLPFQSTMVDARRSVFQRVCRRLSVGHANQQMQKALLTFVDQQAPVWVHFRLPIEFNRKTIHQLKKRNILVTQYMNDDPFSKLAPKGLYWKFHRALRSYDVHFVYRETNVASYYHCGARYVEHCPPTYDTRRHTLNARHQDGTFVGDVAFIGHWENDGRVQYLDALAQAGYRVILRGGGWDKAIQGTSLESLSPISHAYGPEYDYIYANVLIGLCFFSKINNDSWTERALEIIAVGGLLVCERTNEAERLFRDREEAYFFSSIAELIEIVAEIKHDVLRREIVRKAGLRRLNVGKHTIDERAEQVVRCVSSLREVQQIQ